jgi:carbamoyl-phosphate synthase small subunit
LSQKTPAVLVLADGSVFRGCGIGSRVRRGDRQRGRGGLQHRDDRLPGDPHGSLLRRADRDAYLSAHRQRRANAEDSESRDVFAAGLVIRDLPLASSNWRQEEDLSTYLRRHEVVAIGDIDTRRLTRLLRTQGAQNGCIAVGLILRVSERPIDEALERARAAPSMAGLDLAKVVSATGGIRLERERLGSRHRLQAERRARFTSSRTTTA